MRRVLSLVAVLGVLCVPLSSAMADQCICAKVPMWQVSGNDWYHYAIVYNLPVPPEVDCQYLYPTGYVGPRAMNQNCGAACGDCSALPSPASVPAKFYYKGGLLNYTDVDTADKFRAQLIALSESTTQATAGYKDYDFSDPRVVSLKRIIDEKTTQTLYSIIWKIQEKAATKEYGFIGLQINTPPDSVVVKPVNSRCIAAHTARERTGIKHTPIPGLLRVHVNTFDVAIVRLNENYEGGYPECLYSMAKAGPGGVSQLGNPLPGNTAGLATSAGASYALPIKYRKVSRRKRG